MQINKTLLWDYDFAGKYNTEEFKRWYIARVLSCGTKKDLGLLGMRTIKQYLPKLNLPEKIKRFWLWYFQYVYPE